MRLFHYLEIENFKRFGEKQRIELDHPAVLIGPNNCGKTSAIQALALWSQALATWFDVRKQSTAKERTATALNRLNIVSVPVQRTRYFWHNAQVRSGNTDIQLQVTVGVWFRGSVRPLTMRFRNQGEELVYCTPDEKSMQSMEFIEYAAAIRVELLYPMSGLQTQEPILQPGYIGVLLGQGQTAQVLRNLCLIVARSAPPDWKQIQTLMHRLFGVQLETPIETARGEVELQYRQSSVKDPLDIALSGRGFQQLLLIFSYLYSHKRCVLLVDEPDAHLEILRQKQVYVLLRDIATQNDSQVVLVTHSEVILDEALDTNLTLIIDGRADNIAEKKNIKDTLKHFGAEHYVKARERGYVLYVEGGTDVDMLRALAERLNHPVAKIWDERMNTYYVQNNFPDQNTQAELERVEGGFGLTPSKHFFGLRSVLPDLKGLAILDNDGKDRQAANDGNLQIVYWRRYEAENYFITPSLLRRYAQDQFGEATLFGGFTTEIEDTLAEIITERLFAGINRDYQAFQQSPEESARLIWEARTERAKLSDFAEEFFRRLAMKTGTQMLLKKGELHRLIEFADPESIPAEVNEKLMLLEQLFRTSDIPDATR